MPCLGIQLASVPNTTEQSSAEVGGKNPMAYMGYNAVPKHSSSMQEATWDDNAVLSLVQLTTCCKFEFSMAYLTHIIHRRHSGLPSTQFRRYRAYQRLYGTRSQHDHGALICAHA